jgi:hypothetical protein
LCAFTVIRPWPSTVADVVNAQGAQLNAVVRIAF